MPLRAGLGSLSAVTNLSGSVLSRQWYHPYGSVRASTGALPTDIAFTGHRSDASTGLMYFRARYYSGLLGRFVQADTLVPGAGNPQGLNRYSYVYNRPTVYIDPSGHCGVVSGTVGTLDCTYDDFVNMSLADRTAWITALMREPNLANWFNNILGVMNAYADLGMGSQAGWQTSWLGYVNAGILKSIHDGYGVFSGAIDPANSVASGLNWLTFFDTFSPQQLNTVTDEQRIKLWGVAEAAGTSFGELEANARGTSPAVAEQVFLAVGNEYRAGRLPGELGVVGFIGGAGAGGVAGLAICGPKCALAVGLGGGIGGAGIGYGVSKYSEDPRNTIPGSNDHPLRLITNVMLSFR